MVGGGRDEEEREGKGGWGERDGRKEGEGGAGETIPPPEKTSISMGNSPPEKKFGPAGLLCGAAALVLLMAKKSRNFDF